MIKPQIILASASIGRKTLLQKLGIPFQVLVSEINEDAIIHSKPIKMLQMRAEAKAKDVVKKITSSPSSLVPSPYLIIAADSMAILNGKTFGKAKNKQHTQKIIKDLMGKTHEFATATTIIGFKYLKSLKIFYKSTKITTTNVTLRYLSKSELDEYTTRYDFSRFAAGYALNETPWDLVTKIEGSYTNVIGLPFEVILPIIRKYKII